MTALERIRDMPDAAVITAEQAAAVLGCNPHSIRVAARQQPERLGFPVTVLGNRTLIPRIPFIQFIEGVNPNDPIS